MGLEPTQYGQYAEQNRYQGMNTDSHLLSNSFAMRRNSLGITPTRLQQEAQASNQSPHRQICELN